MFSSPWNILGQIDSEIYGASRIHFSRRQVRNVALFSGIEFCFNTILLLVYTSLLLTDLCI